MYVACLLYVKFKFQVCRGCPSKVYQVDCRFAGLFAQGISFALFSLRYARLLWELWNNIPDSDICSGARPAG